MVFVFFNDTATTEIYTLSLHDALPIFALRNHGMHLEGLRYPVTPAGMHYLLIHYDIPFLDTTTYEDRKSTRLNSSHANISYAVFCLKTKKYLSSSNYFTFSSSHLIDCP